jgi:hypothetical protein
LKKDLSVFLDPGFLVTLVLVGLLAAIGAGIIVYADNTYGIPITPYWR